MNPTDSDLSPTLQKRDHELLLLAQKLGRTGYVISDDRTGRVYWSASLFEQRKVTPCESFSREEALSYLHPDDRGHFVQTRDAAIASRKSFPISMRICCGDGSVIWEEGIGQPQYAADGTYSGLLAVVRDVTESRRDAVVLREQEATYRTLFDGMGDAVLLTQHGRFMDCNQAALDMFRCNRDQLIGGTPAAISPERQPDGRLSAEAAQEKIDAALRGSRQTFEWLHQRFDGSTFEAEVTLNRVDVPGQIIYFGVVRDISARKAAEVALQAAHDKFAGAFDSSADTMLVGRIGDRPGAGVIMDANRAAKQILGREPEDLIGRSMAEVGLIGDDTDVAEVRRLLLEGGSVRNFKLTLKHPDGGALDAEINGSRFALGDQDHYLLTVRDVSERSEAERKIRELNESLNNNVRQLRDIIDNLPVLICYQDKDGRFLFVNKTGQAWLAKDESQLLGRSVPEVMSQDYIEATRTMREQRPRGDVRMETAFHYPDGVTRTVDTQLVRDLDEQGAVRGYYTFAADISERKATEEQLRQSQKMEAIGKLTGGIAHDFNNLLAIILGNLELADSKLKDKDEAVQKLLAPALRAADRGATLTRSLLAFARQQPLSPSVFVVTGLIRDMTNLLSRTVPANIQIEFVGGAGLWKCEADAGQLQNALLNLVVNARDAMPEGGKLTIETSNVRLDDDYARTHSEVTPGQYVMLAVSDSGTGMPPDVIGRVFEPFFTTKGLGRGTGLGLSMVYGFAKQSKGHVAIYSEVGQGTTVRIYLPRWLGKDEEKAKRQAAEIPVANNETILVVEDDEDVRFITVTILRSLGYTVVEAETGKQALVTLNNTKGIALLVTDVVLAGDMNGKRVADAAKAMHPGIKVLFMSGYTENAIVHHGRLDAGVHFVQKPFRKQDLAVKVRAALDDATP